MASEGFKAVGDRVVLEAQQAMVAALKEQRYEDALEHAEKVISVQPDNAVAQQFLALLQVSHDANPVDTNTFHKMHWFHLLSCFLERVSIPFNYC
eukprot:scaffold11416_cov45-Prasinocladus_malaysianus.AAC.1